MFIFIIMSPPEIWGPPIWRLFHTLIEKMNPNAYPHVISSMFNMIVAICKFLPCPECSSDATNFLAKINLSNYKTKDEFKNMLYLFHNYINAKKGKLLYNYSNMVKYNSFNLISVINDFIDKYNTKGNMKLLSESFHRSVVIKEFIKWFKQHHRAFITISVPETNKNIIVENKNNEQKKEEPNVTEPNVTEPNVTEPNLREPNVTEPNLTEPNLTEPNMEEQISINTEKLKNN